MNPETIRDLIHARPFVPFEVCLANGEAVAVRRAEHAWAVSTRVYVHIPAQRGERCCRAEDIVAVKSLL